VSDQGAGGGPIAATEARPRRVAWDRVLVWYMRIVALAWIAKGLHAWLIILGADPAGGPALDAMAWPRAGALVAFAVLDLVAGVGLWLTSTWGGVMWLLAVMTHIVVGLLGGPAALPVVSEVVVGVESALVLAYVLLSWLASRED
jgi:hypothetical protein